jgi:hypothetical protein
MPRQPGEKNARRWCYTLNNYTVDDEQRLQLLDCSFHVYGREIGDHGTAHLQGYITFANAKSLATLKALIPRAHLESARGTGEENLAYCSKADPNPFIKGELTSQGKRSDLDGLLTDIKAGMAYPDLIEAHPSEFFKYHGAIDKAMSIFLPDRNWTMEVIWCYGPTGTGKSHYANSQDLPGNIYRKPPGKWWDGYHGQPTVIFDEFRADWFPFYHLLLLLDKYPLKVEIKGGTRNFSSKRIIITCPVKWDECFRSQTEEKLDQLKRRITETRHFPFAYQEPRHEEVDNVGIWQAFEELDDINLPDLGFMEENVDLSH